MVIFGAIATIVTVGAGAMLLVATDSAVDDPTDPELYGFLAIIGLGAPLAWTLLNLGLLAMRGQTGGQYVAGIRLARDDGGRPSVAQAAGWWFCFNPLLFSWPMAIVTGFPLAAVISLILSSATVVLFGALMVLCIASPLIALVSAALDGQNRALHDRVIGVVAVPSE